MKLNKKNILFFICGFFSISNYVFALSEFEYKSNIEKNLTEQSNNIVEVMIPKTHFIIAINATVSIPKKKEMSTDLLSSASNKEEDDKLKAQTDSIFLNKINSYYSTQANKATEIENLEPKINKIEATLIADKSVEESKINLAKGILEKLLKSYSKNASLQVSSENIFTLPEVKTEPQLTTKEVISLVKDPVAILISTVLGIIGLFLINSKKLGVEKLKIEAMKASAEAKNSNGPQEVESHQTTKEVKAEEKTTHKSDNSQVDQSLILISIESKMNNLLEKRPSDLKAALNKLIKDESSQACEIMTVLSNKMNIDLLYKMTKLLGDEERASWKSKILSDLTHEKSLESLERANSLLSKIILDNESKVDVELNEILASINTETAINIIQSDKKYAPFFITYLEPLQVAKILNTVNAEDLSQILNFKNLSESTIDQKFYSDLKESINVENKKLAQEKNPFLDKLSLLIKDISPAKERPFFEAFANSGNGIMLKKITISHFPAELVPELPPSFLLRVFNKFNLVKRAEILSAQPEAMRNKLLLSFGESGKQRDMINIELETIKSNEIKMKQLERNKDSIWLEFISAARDVYKKLPEEPMEIEELRLKWVKALIAENSRGQVEKSA